MIEWNAPVTKEQINAELQALTARALELDQISVGRPWSDAELAEIHAAAERDQALRSRLAAFA